MKKGIVVLIGIAAAGLAVACAVQNRRGKWARLHGGEAGSIGIIGGADGPTAVYVAKKASACPWRGFMVHLCAALSALCCAFLSRGPKALKKEKKACGEE